MQQNHPPNIPDSSNISLPAEGTPEGAPAQVGQSGNEKGQPITFRGVVINGIDVEKLSERMAKADWYYDYSDDHRVWTNGRRELSRIKTDLRLLCEDSFGLKVSNQLWERHVPQASVIKPDFLNAKNAIRPYSLDKGEDINGPVLGHYLAEYLHNIVQERHEQGNNRQISPGHL